MDQFENNSVQKNSMVQNIVLENRKKLSISGVKDVLSFDDRMVNLDTDLGMLTVKGEDIRINKLSLDTTDVIIEGNISSLIYNNRQIKGQKDDSILGKIFK